MKSLRNLSLVVLGLISLATAHQAKAGGVQISVPIGSNGCDSAGIVCVTPSGTVSPTSIIINGNDEASQVTGDTPYLNISGGLPGHTISVPSMPTSGLLTSSGTFTATTNTGASVTVKGNIPVSQYQQSILLSACKTHAALYYPGNLAAITACGSLQPISQPPLQCYCPPGDTLVNGNTCQTPSGQWFPEPCYN